ncbi:DUF222 domain-containing protein [Nocardia sp. NPDC052566]|uniref:HNH endonuclease signature motif containing protein n=1 Tax=Nocardia sp. NPDC052566 TaxID=3364330 RepID=UPI0037C72161
MTPAEVTAEQRVSAPLLAGVNSLLDAPLLPLSDDEVIDTVRDIEYARRILDAAEHRVLVQVCERSIPDKTGAGTLPKFLMHTLRISHREAALRNTAVVELGTFHNLHGDEREPQHPETAQALAEGAICVEHARKISEVLKKIPRHTLTEKHVAAEAALAEYARTVHVDDMGKVGAKLLSYLDLEGPAPDHRERQRRRSLHLSKAGVDGMARLIGDVTPELSALLEPVLAKWARPGMNNPDDPDSPRGDCEHVDREAMVAAAARDTRTTVQRNHDAVLALLHPETKVDHLGTHRGLPVELILTMGIDQLEDAAGCATTATGGTVPITEAIELAAHAKPYLLIFDSQGQPLHFSRRRLASADQRRVLTATLRGCSRPGCDAPASMCAVHHVTEWARGGSTGIDNLTLACDACHALVNDGPNGWKTVVMDRFSEYPGRVGWIAPKHVDPYQEPRVNHRHHPDELIAEGREARRRENGSPPHPTE